MGAYPKEIFTNIKKTATATKTFSVTAELGADAAKPLCHTGWSRFELTMIEKTGNEVKINVANLPAREIYAIYDTCHMIMSACEVENLLAIKTTNNKVNEETPLKSALKASPKMGKNKGKPYSMLCSDTEFLARQKSFLEANVSKYPANQKEIDIINIIQNASKEELDTALTELSSTDAPIPTTSEKIMYHSGMKFLRTREDASGRLLCYDITIAYDMTRTYPFMITIENLWAPIITTPTGAVNIQLSQAVKKTLTKTNLSSIEGLTLMNTMKEKLSQFEQSIFEKQYNTANKMYRDNMAEYKKSKEESTSSTAI